MNVPSPIFADDCASTCATANCLVIGQIAGEGQAITMFLPGDASVVAVQVRNIGAGTLGFQMSADGVNWVPAEMYQQPGDIAVSETTINGVWRGSVAGMSQFRVVSAAGYSGSVAEVTIRATPADLFVSPDADDPAPIELETAFINISETGVAPIIAGVADREVRVHRLKLSASELVRVSFLSSGLQMLSGPETCDAQVLDLDLQHPWYVTPTGEGFSLGILMADGSGAAPNEVPVVVGGTVWYTLSPLPLVFP